jgi:hypothetical protein
MLYRSKKALLDLRERKMESIHRDHHQRSRTHNKYAVSFHCTPKFGIYCYPCYRERRVELVPRPRPRDKKMTELELRSIHQELSGGELCAVVVSPLPVLNL